MKVGSLFSGIGGIDLGLERAGMQIIWQVEKNTYCRKVLKKHWPNVKLYGDIKKIKKDTNNEMEPVDLICGGFPCQDISYAGKGLGIHGKRSGMFFEGMRIIRGIRPRYILFENVAALINRGLDEVLRELAKNGYDAEWFTLRASDFGAPHRRERVFIVGYSNGIGRARIDRTGQESKKRYQNVAHASSGKSEQQEIRNRRKGSPRGSKEDADISDSVRERRIRSNATRTICAERRTSERCRWWAIEPDVGRVAYGVSNRVDRLRGLGNAVVPQVAEFIGRKIVEYDAINYNNQ